MWHGAYISWLEEARIKALEDVGLSYSKISEDGYEMTVVSLDIKYKKAIKHGQYVVLESFPLEKVGLRWPWVTNFIADDNLVMAEARVELVLVKQALDEYRLIRAWPDNIEAAFSALMFGSK